MALGVPIALLSMLSMITVEQAWGDRAGIRRQTELARAALWPAELIEALQNERIWAPLEMFGLVHRLTPAVEGYEATRSRTDTALSDLERRLPGADRVFADAVEPALTGLRELEQLRADIDAFRQDGRESGDTIAFGFDVFERYTALIAPLYDVQLAAAVAIDDARLQHGVELAGAVARSIEVMSLLAVRTIDDAVLSVGGVDRREEVTSLASLLATLGKHVDSMATTDRFYADLADALNGQTAVNGLDALVEQAISTGEAPLQDLVEAVDPPRDEGLFAYQDTVHGLVRSWADTLDARADARLVWPVVVVVGAAAITAAMGHVVARSLTHPLVALAERASSLAQHELPALTDVADHSTGQEIREASVHAAAPHPDREVAQVTDALDSVRAGVLELAANEARQRQRLAGLVVSLDGRNQALLDHQIELIEVLTEDSYDPHDQARLTRIGQVAARLRSNSHSLLVVAGIEPPHRPGAPVDIHEVVREGLRQTDAVRPVVFGGIEPGFIAGHRAADVSYLIAELIEVTGSHGGADDPIELRGRRDTDTGGYWLVINDPGARFSPSDLASANQQLSGDVEPRGFPSHDLDHFVAGHLARHGGVTVHLTHGRPRGVTTTVHLPSEHVRAQPVQSAPLLPARLA